MIFQQPNFFGCLEPAPDLAAVGERRRCARGRARRPDVARRARGARGATAARWRSARGRATGNYPSFGGPHYGFLAARNEYIRRMPGTDRRRDDGRCDGERGYVLTLQTREQHIRREKATSNITTNQTLLALAGLVAPLVARVRRGCARWGRPAWPRGVREGAARAGRAGVSRTDNIQGVCRSRRTERP